MNEPFERKGVWWLPTKPEERVYGTLHFDPREGITVDLLGRFSQVQGDTSPFWQPEIVLGNASNGEPMTLLHCFEPSMTIGVHAFYEDRFVTSTIGASALFVGQHFGTKDDIKFSKLTLGFSHALNWADVVQVETGHEERKAILTYERPEEIEVSLPGDLILSLGYVLSVSNGFQGASMTKSVRWDVESSAEKSFEDWWRIQYLLQAFLTLATRQPVHPISAMQVLEVVVELPDGETGKGYDKTELFWDTPESTDEKRTQFGRDMLFVLRDLGQGEQMRLCLERCLRLWFDKAERLQAVCELYLGTVQNKHIYPIHRFSNLVQALESYHRGASNQDIPLRSRLDSLTQDYERVIGRTLPRRQDFVQKVLDTRNYLTHYDPRKKPRAVQGADLHFFSLSLQHLVEMSLLQELGFDEPWIGRIITRDRRRSGWLEDV